MSRLRCDNLIELLVAREEAHMVACRHAGSSQLFPFPLSSRKISDRIFLEIDTLSNQVQKIRKINSKKVHKNPG